jgi:bifunctional enzyme CysN/CysC
MAPSTALQTEIDRHLARHQTQSLLRFITCGSVDDGKSTLIGRLLYEAKALFEDQLQAVVSDSKRWGTQGNDIDFALLVDGLAAEREQGITIDVAYRFFCTEKRKFIVADTPGHEQYTRNMITGASTADLAIILLDARKGALTQTRRHSYLVSLIGIRQVVLAVNKMDLVDYSQTTFRDICDQYRDFARSIDLNDVHAIPLSALRGDNVVERSPNMPWYQGPTLMELLESIELNDSRLSEMPLRLPVQWVNRPNDTFRGFCGTVASGHIHVGERVRLQPSGRQSRVARIINAGREATAGFCGQSITVTLEDEIDVSRGDLISAAASPAEVADQFQATIVWMGDDPLLPGRPYLLKLGTQTATATVTKPKYKVNVNTMEHLAATHLELNEVGVFNISLDRMLAFDPYRDNRNTGGFILIDRLTNNTVGAGVLHFALRRAHNIHAQHVDLTKEARAERLGQKPAVLWFTGISGAGKSTIANLVEKRLHAMGRHSYLLDGDNLRHGLNRDLGFTEADRIENIRRVAEVSRLMADAGLIVLTAFISPFRAERAMARSLFAKGEFIEIFVDTPLIVAESRDVKGLYRKARRGELSNFTGIDSPYEPPEAAELVVDTTECTPEEAAAQVVARLLGH